MEMILSEVALGVPVHNLSLRSELGMIAYLALT